MKAIITQTDGWPNIGSKIKKEVTYLDYRNVSSFKEAENLFWYKAWRDRGINHREENEMIVCDVIQEKELYEIEVSSISDLVNIMKSQGHDIVLSIPSYKEYDLQIEIYNDYRE